jgi:hypothetical protein
LFHTNFRENIDRYAVVVVDDGDDNDDNESIKQAWIHEQEQDLFRITIG